MKTLEKSFKVETRTIEEFFNNRAYFPTKSNQIVGYLYSVVGTRFFHVVIQLEDITYDYDWPYDDEGIEIMEIKFSSPIERFLRKIEEYFNSIKTKFKYIKPTRPFHITVIQWEDEEERVLLYQMYNQDRNFTGPGIVLTEVFRHYPGFMMKDEEKVVINTTQSFKSDECVICLTNPPNVLFCNCEHIAICVECDKVKSLKICPVCTTENIIKRTIYD